jgi:DNA processing protein
LSSPDTATPEEISAWLRVTRAEGIDRATLRLLLAEFGLPEAILSQSVNAIARFTGRDAASRLKSHFTTAQEEIANATMDWIARGQRSVLTIADNAYPSQLLEAPDAPFMLFADGTIDRLSVRRVALSAPIDASSAGIETGASFARALAARGVPLAVEFGSLFSKAVIEAVQGVKGGDMVAVLADGPSQISPADQVEVARTVAKENTLLSALAPGEFRLPAQSRHPSALLVGLCAGVLVIEAPLNSRPFATAKLAAEVGRDVMAIPGSIHSPLARGCHRLIRDGARLVESVEDILEEIQRTPSKQAPTAP